LTLIVALTTVLRTTVLHCDYTVMRLKLAFCWHKWVCARACFCRCLWCWFGDENTQLWCSRHVRHSLLVWPWFSWKWFVYFLVTFPCGSKL